METEESVWTYVLSEQRQTEICEWHKQNSIEWISQILKLDMDLYEPN